jgi:uncharacterized protein (UPF0276 family)
MKLAANYSNALRSLIEADEVEIGAVEVGPWYPVNAIRQFQNLFPDLEFYYHPGNIVIQVGRVPGTVKRLKSCLEVTDSPWASCHLSLLMPVTIWLAKKIGWFLPPPQIATSRRRFISSVANLKAAINLPVILENMPTPPDKNGRYAFNSEADFIMGILEETGCDLLLDMAHARIAAGARDMEVFEYLSSLPLERVIQIHLSGARLKGGCLVDAHEPLEDIDYTIFEWLLERTYPKIVTLEYFREPEPLRWQILRLQRILAASG